MKTEAQQQHRWLLQLVGEWRFEVEAQMGPDKPVETFHGTESVRALGELWVLCEGSGEMPGGGIANTLMTLGYDSQRQRFIGSWVGSMMSHMWVYDGELDAEQKVLTLHTEGPDFSNAGKTAKYKDVIELKSAEHRVLSSHSLGEDGEWHCFMTANYWRLM